MKSAYHIHTYMSNFFLVFFASSQILANFFRVAPPPELKIKKEDTPEMLESENLLQKIANKGYIFYQVIIKASVCACIFFGKAYTLFLDKSPLALHGKKRALKSL